MDSTAMAAVKPYQNRRSSGREQLVVPADEQIVIAEPRDVHQRVLLAALAEVDVDPVVARAAGTVARATPRGCPPEA